VCTIGIGRTFVYMYIFPGFCATKSTVDLQHVSVGATDIALFEASLHAGMHVHRQILLSSLFCKREI
jgi:hypothetical protein